MRRILLVEDSRTQAEHLRLLLEGEGFAVAVARDGREGLELFQASDFDLVLTDVLMPALGGYELCRRIKHHPTKNGVPVILLTALNDPLDILEGVECGADSFLTKPYRTDVLLNRIRYVFANKARRVKDKVKVGIEVNFLGKTFTVTSDQGQILDLLIGTCEEIIRSNRELRASRAELAAAKALVEEHAHRLEGQARSSENKYQRLMEQASDAIVLLDTAGRVLEVNHRAEELLGQPAAEVVGRHYEDFAPAAERTAAAEQFKELLARGVIRRDNVHFTLADGQVVCIDYTASLVDFGGGRAVLAIVHDASERQRLEQQLRQAQKMEAIGQLAGGVAHDFNNLLTVITGYGELLLGRLPAGDPMRELVEEIHKAGERAASLTRQLLVFSRRQVIAPRVLDLNAIVADVERMLRRLIGEDVALTTILDPDLGRVQADAGQVEQILLNLAVNARDAMPQGGQLTIETGNADLGNEFARLCPEVRPGSYVMLAVADTGMGMDETTKARIFEPFFTTKGLGKGTGLGLATVYGIVKQSGGCVWVDSEPERGTTFKIYLPRVEAALSAPVRAQFDGHTLGTETLLLVEDEDGVRAIARHVLRMVGYTVLEARHGDEAIRHCEEHQDSIHLLVTDVVLPGLGGRELADHVVRLRPGIKVLFVSGYTNDAVVRHGVLAAEATFLQKPFTMDALARKVREVLDAAPQE